MKIEKKVIAISNREELRDRALEFLFKLEKSLKNTIHKKAAAISRSGQLPFLLTFRSDRRYRDEPPGNPSFPSTKPAAVDPYPMGSHVPR